MNTNGLLYLPVVGGARPANQPSAVRVEHDFAEQHTNERKRPADPSDLNLESQRQRLGQAEERMRVEREHERARDESDDVNAAERELELLPALTAYENSLHELTMNLFRAAKRDNSFSLMHECLSFSLKYILEEDDDLTNFCKDYACKSRRGRFHGELTTDQIDALKSGVFPFTKEQGTSLNDTVAVYIDIGLWQPSPNVNNGRRLSFLLTLLLVKLYLKNEQNTSAIKLQDFLSTEQGQMLVPVSSVLSEYVQGDASFRGEQEEQLQRLIDIIDWRDCMILPALIHPGPLQQADHSFMVLSRIFESRKLLEYFEYDFDNTPGALQVLIDRFGRWPRYIGPVGEENPAIYCSTPDSACAVPIEELTSITQPAESPCSVSPSQEPPPPEQTMRPHFFIPIQLLPTIRTPSPLPTIHGRHG